MTLKTMSRLLRDNGNCYVAAVPTKTQLRLLQAAVGFEIEVRDAVYAKPGYVIQRKGMNKEVNNNVDC